MGVVAVSTLGALAIATGVAGAAGALFQPYQAFATGSWPEAVAVGDVTGDGRADVVMTTGFYFDSANDYRVWVFAQTAAGTLATPVSYPTGSTASACRCIRSSRRVPSAHRPSLRRRTGASCGSAG